MADLNRVPTDIDSDSVEGAIKPSGSHSDGLHWVKTKNGDLLMPQPMSNDLHKVLLELCYQPFHKKVQETYAQFLSSNDKVYQLDVHSMPSLGTVNHRDPGEARAEVVVSDQDGKSCDPRYTKLVYDCFSEAGFQVKLNWPYKGGGITQTYGQPNDGKHCVQVELNRSLYMDEKNKSKNAQSFDAVQNKIAEAMENLFQGVSRF